MLDPAPRFPSQASQLRNSISELRSQGLKNCAELFEGLANLIDFSGNVAGETSQGLDAMILERAAHEARGNLIKSLRDGRDIQSRTGKLAQIPPPAFDKRKTVAIVAPAATSNGINYGSVLEVGTGQFTVVPKTKKCLRFVIDGREIFTKKAVIQIPPKRWISHVREALDVRGICNSCTQEWLQNLPNQSDAISITIR